MLRMSYCDRPVSGMRRASCVIHNLLQMTSPTGGWVGGIVPWEVLYQNCSNHSAPLHKMATRAKNRKKTNNISSVTTGQISTNLIRLFLGRSFTKIAEIISLHCTKWPPELKIKKKKTSDISITTGRISTT